MAELADAYGSGPYGANPWRFESSREHEPGALILRATNNRAVFRSEPVARCHRLDDCHRRRDDCAQHEEGGDDDFNQSAALVLRSDDQIVGKFSRVHM